MATRFVFEGLEELKAELRELPAALAGEASGIVLTRGERAKQDILAAYPERTGALRRGLKLRYLAMGQFGAGIELRNTAPHAQLYEVGSQARHTAIGANRGSMPPGNIFVPTISRQRRAMYGDLRDLLVRHGLEVSGDGE